MGKHFSVQCENLDNRADLLSWGGNPPLRWLDKASSQRWVPPASHTEPRALPSCPEDGPSKSVCATESTTLESLSRVRFESYPWG